MSIIHDFRVHATHCEHGVPLPKTNCSICTPCGACESWGYSSYRIGCPEHFPAEHARVKRAIERGEDY